MGRIVRALAPITARRIKRRLAGRKKDANTQRYNQAFRFFRERPGLTLQEAREYAKKFLEGEIPLLAKGRIIDEKKELAWRRDSERRLMNSFRDQIKKSDRRIAALNERLEKTKDWNARKKLRDELGRIELENMTLRRKLVEAEVQFRRDKEYRQKDQTRKQSLK